MEKFDLLIADVSEEYRAQIAAYFRGTEQVNIIAEASNGLEVLERIAQYQPDVLLMDIVMPELDGYGVLKQMKSLGCKKPYTIVISQLHADICINKALAEGADYYLLKPLNMASLHEHLMLLGSAKSKREEKERLQGAAVAATIASYPRAKGSLDEKITNIFITVGIPAHIKGYQFLREAIKLTIESPDIINSITKRLYPTVARNFETSSSKVERAIRHAIDVAWARGKLENMNGLFGAKGNVCEYKPTNGEFIALIADKMLIEGA